MNGKPLLRAPYMKGELGVPTNIHVLFGMVMAILFVVMPLAFLGTVKFINFEAVNYTFVGIWIIAFAFIMWMEARANMRPKFNGFHLATFAITLIGLPGVFVMRPRALELFMTIAFWLILVLRNFSVFMVIPQVAMKMRRPATELIQTWLFVGGLIIVGMTNLFYASRGFTALNAQRGAFPDWLHPNSSAIYGGVLLLTAVTATQIKLWLRIFGGTMGLYCILLVQSRGALVASVVALVVYFALAFFSNPGKYSLWLLGAVVFGGLIAVGLGEQIMEVGAVKNMVERSTLSDPTAGRLDYIAGALESAKESPLVGYGFRAPRVDNIFATFALQYGLIGSLFYLVFVLSIMFRSVVVYRSQTTALGKDAARLVIVYGAFIFTRSFVESAHIMQITDVFANAFCMLAGILYLVPAAKKSTTNVHKARMVIERPTQSQA